MKSSELRAKRGGNLHPYLAAFMIPFAVCVLVCIANGFYPFGNNCILHVDMYHQYCPFFMEFLEKLRHGGSLQYSWNLGLGSDFISLYAYYLASPLNWLLIFCPRSLVIEFMTLMILIKIGGCGLTFFHYLNVHYGLRGKDGRFHERTAVPAIVFASAYALSGFVAAYYWDIMWMDCIALFPLILAGIDRLVLEKKAGLYYISLAVCIWANYYISIMICIFLVLYFGYLFLLGTPAHPFLTGKRLGGTLRFGIYSLLAGGTSAALLLPEIAILGTSGSASGGFPKKMEWYFSIIAELGRMATTASVYTANDHWPNLYAGAFCLVLVCLYLFNRRIRLSEKALHVLMLACFLISFANNQLDYIWHGMHFPQSLPGRQSFIYIFVLLSMSFATIRKWRGIRKWQILLATELGIGMLIAAALTGDPEVTEHAALLITALFVLVYGMLLLLTKLTSARYRRLLAQVLVFIAVLELAVNMAVTGFPPTSRTNYVAKMEEYDKLLAAAEERAQGESLAFYRVEDTSRKTKNDDSLYGYKSSTIFSSLMNLDVSHLFQSVFMEGGLNFYSYNGANPLTSAMLSVKYLLAENDLQENEFHHLIARTDKAFLYENTYTLPLGFMMDEEVIESWQPTLIDRVKSVNDLAELLGASGPLLENAFCRTEVEPGITTIHIPEEGYYYAAYDVCDQDSLTVSRADGWSQTYGKTTHQYLIGLENCQTYDTVTITNSGEESIHFSVYRLNVEAFRAAYEKLAEQEMTLTEQTDRKIAGTIEVDHPGRLIFSIPADEGWKLYVDGQEREIEPLENALIGVHLEKGRHQVELRYTTPGLLVGLAISLTCVALAVLLLLIKRVNCDKMVKYIEERGKFPYNETE